MKTRTNQPIFLDNGNPVNDSALGGTQLYKHTITIDEWHDPVSCFVIISTNPNQITNFNSIVNEKLIGTLITYMPTDEYVLFFELSASYDDVHETYDISGSGFNMFGEYFGADTQPWTPGSPVRELDITDVVTPL